MDDSKNSDSMGALEGNSAARERLLSLLLAADREKRKSSHSIAARGRWTGDIPLSFAQERLWFLHELGLAGPAYNISLTLRLSGSLVEAALERSFTDLIHRHESLRTNFGVNDGVPHQRIGAPGVVEMQRVDLRNLENTDQREDQLRECIRREQVHQFQLSEGPLLRITLVTLGVNEHALLLTMHHIISDGWSLGVLVSELNALYGAYVRGDACPLSEPTVQYADYAIWQRRLLEEEVVQQHLGYWREQLRGVPPQLYLPTDRPRPAVESFKGARVNFKLPNAMSDALKELSRREGATLFMVFLAAYQILLSRWSGQQDIVVGSPISGRGDRQLEGLIGFFVNTIVLRSHVSTNRTFRETLTSVKETTLGAYEHQELPFELLVKEVRPDRNLTRQPIFQVMLALQNYPDERLELPGLTWTWIEAERVTTHFDLTLYLYETSTEVLGVFEYATDLFDQQTIERMADNFQALLEWVVANPNGPVYQSPLLDEKNRRRVLVEWNATSAQYPRESCVHHLFAEQAARTPDAPALVCNGASVSYAELNMRANRLAHHLIALGVKPDTIVGVNIERSIELIVALLGILKAGGAYMPLDPAYPRERTAFMIEEAQVSVVLSMNGNAEGLQAKVKHVVCLDQGVAQQESSLNPVQYVHPKSLAYVLYTSGSTGRPKAIGVVHQNIVRLVVGTNYIDISRKDVFLQLAPPTFDAATFEIWGALLHGAKLVLYPDREIDLDRLHPLLIEQRVTVLWLTAGLFHQVMDVRPQLLASLRCLLAGGDVLSVIHCKQALKEFSGCRLINGYGPTEATTFSVCFAITDPGLLTTSTPIGYPISNTRAYVLDGWMQPVPIGVTGELYIGGDGLARGYLRRPSLTAERFVANPIEAGGARAYRTGDLVRWRSDGSLEFVGRVDTQVKIRGYRVELSEIDAVLLEHPAVKQAVVLAREDFPGDRRLVAYVVGDRSALTKLAFQGVPEKLRNEVVGDWVTLYEDTYGSVSQAGPSFVGWNSSYTGQPIPEVQMQEWLASVLKRIQSLRPRKVLEIGCGVGLLLQHLAPQCDMYMGTDFSASAIEQLRQWLDGRPDLEHVVLLHRSATELQDLESGSFDTVILNSVVQYFPDTEYLLAVLREAVRLLGPGGKIFVGDVRHLGLLTTFHSAVQLGKAAAPVSASELRQRVGRAVAQDKELVIDPKLFWALPGRVHGIYATDVQLKRGRAPNELTRYRYDVVLHTTEQDDLPNASDSLDWKASAWSVADLEAALKERRWCGVRVHSIPNQRLARELAAKALIESGDEHLEAIALRRQLNEAHACEVDPETICELADAYGYEARASWDTSGIPGDFEVQLIDHSRSGELPRAARSTLREVKAWSAYANDPLEAGFRQQLIPQLRQYLQRQVPEYMIPTAWMVLKQLPLTANSKVDRQALPNPLGRPEQMGEYAAPQTELQRILADIWAQLLQVDQVGIKDNFFELGGHSLHGMKLIAKIAERIKVRLSVVSVFQHPTIETMAKVVDSIRSAQGESVNPLPLEFDEGTI